MYKHGTFSGTFSLAIGSDDFPSYIEAMERAVHIMEE